MDRETLKRVLDALANGNEHAFVAAPCVFCGHNGPLFFGPHPEPCPWHEETGLAGRQMRGRDVAVQMITAALAAEIARADREAAARQEAERRVEYYREQTGRMLRARYDNTAMDAQERALAAEAERDRLRAELAVLRG